MAITKIGWKPKGFRELRSEPRIVADLESRARKIAAAANASSGLNTYFVGSQQGKPGPIPAGQAPFMEGSRGFQSRWRTTVITGDFAAQLDNARYDTLLKSLDFGR